MKTNIYTTLIQAQCALSNKRDQLQWRIVRDDNGWYRLLPREAK